MEFATVTLVALALARPAAVGAETAGGDQIAASKKKRKKRKNSETAKGRIRIIVDGGWGTVTVNGHDFGKTPTTAEVSPGKKTVYIFPFGKSPHFRKHVEVQAGAEAVVKLQLETPKSR